MNRHDRGRGALFGQVGDALAISPAALGVSQLAMRPGLSIPATDEYGAIYLEVPLSLARSGRTYTGLLVRDGPIFTELGTGHHAPWVRGRNSTGRGALPYLGGSYSLIAARPGLARKSAAQQPHGRICPSNIFPGQVSDSGCELSGHQLVSRSSWRRRRAAQAGEGAPNPDALSPARSADARSQCVVAPSRERPERHHATTISRGCPSPRLAT